jgi:hypothetical protein
MQFFSDLLHFVDAFYEGPLLERKSRITFRQDQGVQTLLITIGVTGEVYKGGFGIARISINATYKGL